MTYQIERYYPARSNGESYRVIAITLISPDQVLTDGDGSIHKTLIENELDKSIGLYFYRFENLQGAGAFSKIGEVSRQEGIIERKKRGWLAQPTYAESYKKPSNRGVEKVIFTDVKKISDKSPMFFVFYEFDKRKSFPRIDEVHAFACHKSYFGKTTRNREQANTFYELGRDLVWHPSSFHEVLTLSFPSGNKYEKQI